MPEAIWISLAFALGLLIKSIGLPSNEAAATLAQLEGAQIAARAEENPELFGRSLQLLSSRFT